MEPTTRRALWKKWDDLMDKADEIKDTLDTLTNHTSGTAAGLNNTARAQLAQLQDIADDWKALLIQTEVDEGNKLRKHVSELATTAAAILDMTTTTEAGTKTCGIPYHAAELYLLKLCKAGRRVALCDELEKPPRQPEPEPPPQPEPPRPSKFGVLANVSAKTARAWIERTDAAARAIGREIKFEVKQAWEKKGIMYPDSAENILRLCQHGRGLTVIAWKDYPDFPPLFAEELDAPAQAG